MTISIIGYQISIKKKPPKDGHMLGVQLRYRKDAKARYRKVEKAVAECAKFDDWFNNRYEPNNAEAKTTLRNFFNVYLDTAPDKHFERSYSEDATRCNLYRIQTALEERNYPRACNEVVSLFVYEPILQRRIYEGLKKLYHEHLEVK